MPTYSKMEMAELAAKYGFQRDTFEKVLRLKKISTCADGMYLQDKCWIISKITFDYNP